MTMSERAIVMIGATGAVGDEVVRELVNHDRVSKLTLLGRRPVEIASEKVDQHTVDIFDPSSYDACLSGHQVAICTLGVGQPAKMSKEDFVRIDKQAVLDFAARCKAAGVTHFHLLCSVGADPKSRSFYLRTKGELQEGLKALAFERLSLYQPSMILTPENRYGVTQGLTLALWPTVSRLMFGPLQKFRGIAVEQLGRAIAHNALATQSGVEILQWQDIVALA